MKNFKKQYGFSAIEGLLVILVLVALTGAGYFVWHKDNAKKPTSTSKTASSAKTYPIATTGTVCATFPTQDRCETADNKIYQLPKVSSSAKYVVWAGVPSSLQNSITTNYEKTGCSDANSAPAKEDAAANTKNGEGILFDTSGNYATLAYGCGEGGAVYLYVKTGNTWQQVAVTQVGNWACDIVAKYKVSKSFLASPDGYAPLCYVSDKSNDQRVL